MKQKYRAIIFDLDGVIIDSMKLHTKLEKEVCKKYKIKVPSSVSRKFPGWKIEEIFSYIVKNFSDKKIDIKRMIKDKYKAMLKLVDKEIKEVPGAIEFVKRARKFFKKTALVTSSEKKFTELILKKFNLKGSFDVVMTANDFVRGKPDPEPYLKAIKLLKVKPGECIVIEDADNGIVSAKVAGCKTIGITTTFSREKLIKAGADYIVNNFLEVNLLMNKIYGNNF